MEQRFWKQTNGLHFVVVDEDEKRVTVIVTPEWTLEVIPANTGASLIERGSPFGLPTPVHMPGLPPGTLARVNNTKVFDCVQTSPKPVLSGG